MAQSALIDYTIIIRCIAKVEFLVNKFVKHFPLKQTSYSKGTCMKNSSEKQIMFSNL